MPWTNPYGLDPDVHSNMPMPSPGQKNGCQPTTLPPRDRPSSLGGSGAGLIPRGRHVSRAARPGKPPSVVKTSRVGSHHPQAAASLATTASLAKASPFRSGQAEGASRYPGKAPHHSVAATVIW